MSHTSTPAHSSRKAPVCADCMHLVQVRHTQMCNHPHMPVDLVTGGPAWKASHARSVYSTSVLMGLDFKPCGPAGSLFAQRTADVPQAGVEGPVEGFAQVSHCGGKGSCTRCLHERRDELGMVGSKAVPELGVEVGDGLVEPVAGHCGRVD